MNELTERDVNFYTYFDILRRDNMFQLQTVFATGEFKYTCLYLYVKSQNN